MTYKPKHRAKWGTSKTGRVKRNLMAVRHAVYVPESMKPSRPLAWLPVPPPDLRSVRVTPEEFKAGIARLSNGDTGFILK